MSRLFPFVLFTCLYAGGRPMRLGAETVEKTIADVARGVELVTTAYGAFGDVSSAIRGGGRSVAEIANGSNEQASGLAGIGTAMTQIESVTHNNVANSRAAAEAAEAMAEQVRKTRSHLDALMSIVGAAGGD